MTRDGRRLLPREYSLPADLVGGLDRKPNWFKTLRIATLRRSGAGDLLGGGFIGVERWKDPGQLHDVARQTAGRDQGGS
jgi:hypothetical protein